MKKVCVWFVFLLVAVLFSSMAAAGTIVVRAGDNLTKVAQENGTTLASLKLVNPQIKNPNHILVGQVVNLPMDKETVQMKDNRHVAVIKSGSIIVKQLVLLKNNDFKPVSNDGTMSLKKQQNSSPFSFKKGPRIEPMYPDYPVFRYKIPSTKT